MKNILIILVALLLAFKVMALTTVQFNLADQSGNPVTNTVTLTPQVTLFGNSTNLIVGRPFSFSVPATLNTNLLAMGYTMSLAGVSGFWTLNVPISTNVIQAITIITNLPVPAPGTLAAYFGTNFIIVTNYGSFSSDFSGVIISAACYAFTNITTNSVSWPSNNIPLINNGSTLYQNYLAQYNYNYDSPCDIEAVVQISADQSGTPHWVAGDLTGSGPDGVDGFAITTNVLASTNNYVAVLLHQDLHLDEHDYYLLNITQIPTNATICTLGDSGFVFSTNSVTTNLNEPYNMTTCFHGLVLTNILQ